MRSIATIFLYIIGLAAVLHSVVCENITDAIAYSLVCVACAVCMPHRVMLLLGVLLCGGAVGMWHLHMQLSLIILVYGMIMLVGYAYAKTPFRHKLKRWEGVVLMMSGLYALYESGAVQASYLQSRERHIAILNRGKWGVEHPHQQTLNITGQYSYDMFRDFTGAELVNDLSTLDAYTDMVLITPTQPFAEREIEQLKVWVSHGGHLVVITDHTDLFGHVRAIEALLGEFGIRARKDCIIEKNPDSCVYYSLHKHYKGLTANSFSGKGAAFLWQIGFSERADYASHSFFSDNQVADDDKAGIYAVGLRRAYKQGMITLFGDSTLFANFAISFPSSQQIMRTLFSPSTPWNPHLFVFFLSCISLFFRYKSYICAIIGGLIVLVITSFIVGGYHAKAPCFHPTKALTFPVSGDHLCVEGEGGAFRTMFAAAYAYGIIPVWSDREYAGPGLKMGNRNILSLDNYTSSWNPQRTSEEILTSPCTCQLREYIYTLIVDSGKSSFWFDAGVGLLRDCAYRLFWSFIAGSEEITLPEFAKAEKRKVTLISQDGVRYELETYIRNSSNTKDEWVILGDWILGKRISDDTLLVRAIWQHPTWTLGDCVVKISFADTHLNS